MQEITEGRGEDRSGEAFKEQAAIDNLTGLDR